MRMPLRPHRLIKHFGGKVLFAAVLFTTLLSIQSRPVYAAGGDLDPNFGSGGKVAYHFSQFNAIGSDITTGTRVAVQPDGKIVIGMNITTQTSFAGVLARLNTDGTLDTTFGDGGKVLVDFIFGVEALALQADGKILVGGESNLTATIERFNSNGSPDTTFGSGGKAQLGTSHGHVYDIALQSDGKIVAVGTSGSDKFLLARFSSNGTPDAAFGTGGLATQTPFTNVNTTREEGHAVVIQPDGKILVGYQFTTNGSTVSGRVLRFNTNGSVDATFTLADLNASDVPDLALQSDGKIIAALRLPAGLSSFAIARLNPDGSLDNTFDGDGIASTSFVDRAGTTVGGIPYAVGVQSDGKIVVIGTAGSDFAPNGVKDFALARFSPNGSLDTTFGNAGRVLTDFSNRSDTARDFAFQADGKIVVVGTDSRDLAVARYFANETPLTQVQFSASTYTVNEDCTARAITVTRSGVTSGTTTVEYSATQITGSVPASPRSIFTEAVGTLVFNPGEISKDFNILITENGYFSQGNVSVLIVLGEVTGGGLGQRSTAVLTINDDETAHLTTNPIDDPQTFVCQHYHDFLNRQPDAPGEAFWTNQITACGSNQQCIADRRNDVSTAFFLSIEFQQTGYFVIRLDKVGLGDTPANPRMLAFLRDTQEVGRNVAVGVGNWEQQLENNRQSFALAFVARPEFVAAHNGQSREQYVDSLFANAGVTPTTSERDAALAAYGTGDNTGRASALRSVAESKSVYNKLYNEAFVLMQYFGYLRRDPDASPDGNFSGYQFWLSKLNSFSQPGEDVRDDGVALRRVRNADMVKAFITSSEYRSRFGF